MSVFMLKTSKQFKRKTQVAQATRSGDPLLQAWEKTLRENGERPAILDPGGSVARTFSTIEERAIQFAAELDPIEAGEVIAIQIGNRPDWPSLFLACLRKRVVVLPLEQTMSDEQRKAAFATCGVVATANLGGSGVTLERVLPVKTPAATTIWGKNQPSLLKLTSGTTSAPRAIRFRSEQLLADCENVCDTMGISARDLNFGVIPVSHSYGFSNLLTPLLARAVPLALSSDRMPRAILDGIAATGATVFPGMPVFFQSFCELIDTPPLPKLRLCISAGAPLSAELAEKFRARFRRIVHSFYGSSECGGICYVREPNATPGFVGPAMRGVEIEPIGANGAPPTRPTVPQRKGTALEGLTQLSGPIRVRSAAVGDGYFPEPDATKLGRGIFVPDDLLERTPAGYRIVGRASDLINVAGKKVNPVEVEAQLRQCPGVREAVVFARESARRNQEVAACVVATSEVSEAHLLAHCRRGLSSWQTPRRIFLVDHIPVNERGKINRRDLAQRYTAGS